MIKEMKKSCTLWMFALLMLAVGMSSCSSDEIEKIPYKREIYNFGQTKGVDADTYQRLSVFFQSFFPVFSQFYDLWRML